MNKILARLLGVLVVVVLVTAGCGEDDETSTPAGVDDEISPDGASADDGPSAVDGDGSATDGSDESSDDGSPDDSACAADGDDCMSMTDDGLAMEGSDHGPGDGGHHHADGIEVPGGMAIPEISLEITADATSGQNLQVSLEHFVVTPENASLDPVDGEGHLHLYVDGVRIMRFYNEWLHLQLEPGDHMVEVEVSANDHSPYTVGGEAIRAMAMATVPEPGESHSHDDTVDFAGAVPPRLTLAVTEDPKSGWNIHADVAGLVIAPEQVGGDHVEGEGHLHLLVDGQKVTRLYGSWWHLPTLDPGEHEVTVELATNDHRIYAVGGEPVRASTIVVAAGEVPDDGGTDGGAPMADVVIDITFEGGSVGVVDDRIAVDRGSEVALVIRSDVAEHVHVHGYDLFVNVAPGQETVLMFTADVPGVFEIEFEDSFAFITELQVS